MIPNAPTADAINNPHICHKRMIIQVSFFLLCQQEIALNEVTILQQFQFFLVFDDWHKTDSVVTFFPGNRTRRNVTPIPVIPQQAK